LGGPQTRPFILHPVELPLPDDAIVGAASVHAVLRKWRQLLQAEDRAQHVAAAAARE
jgi:hypothetical protein